MGSSQHWGIYGRCPSESSQSFPREFYRGCSPSVLGILAEKTVEDVVHAKATQVRSRVLSTVPCPTKFFQQQTSATLFEPPRFCKPNKPTN